MQFVSQNILISGASSDIGLAIAKSLSQEGARLLLHTSSESGRVRLKAEFSDSNHVIFKSDFSHIENISTDLSPLLKKYPIHGLVNCVGMRSRRPLKLLKYSHVEEVMRLNFHSFLELIRLSISHYKPLMGLSIVQISSIASQSGGPGVAAYAASKAAVDAAVRSLSKELYSKGVRLNSVICGQVNSREYDKILAVNSQDSVLERQYLGLNEPEEISDIVVFLLSKRSQRISGHFIPADGGYLQ